MVIDHLKKCYSPLKLNLRTRMINHPYLFRNLTEVVDEPYCGCLFQWVVYVVDIHLTLIKQMVEDIYSFYCGRALLFVAKD